MTETPKYVSLGALIAEARRRAGLPNQADLAAVMKITQQTVSRWEAGDSRPRANQIAALAAALKLDTTLLMERAGYSTPAVQSFDQPFPVDQLAADTFERFVQHFVDRKYAGKAKVRRAGGTGHKQDGVDVVATFNDGGEHIFQCKRHKQFGPADVAKAVKEYTGAAKVKHLVLSRVASPQTDAALREAGWELWDKDDLSRMIRTDLSIEDQERLVDIFFRGQRQALLGRPEPGPWMTTDEFFRPFEGRAKAFSHDHPLRGREKEIEALITALEDPDQPVVMLTGAGGMGKSRVLKEALTKYAAAHGAVTVRILSREADATPESLANLGAAPKVLVIDDAHERDGLAGILQYAASTTPHTHVLISTRPYAKSRIAQEAAIVSLPVSEPIGLGRLSKQDSIALAREVLSDFEVDPDIAETIVEHVGDNPLVTLMAARIIGAEKLPLEAAKNAKVLRETILGKFQRVIIGDLGGAGDEKLVKAMLDVLALIQPFHIEDPALLDLLEKLKGIDQTEATRLMRLLLDGGLIYQRGGQYRLMPDLLGDYIIEQSCIGPTQKLSPFAEQAFEAVEAKHLQNLLLNLARMDWRLSEGDPAKSPLLDGIWKKLRHVESEYDPHLEAIAQVAIYQPRQALDFVEYHIREGTEIGALAQILRAIAFNYDYLDDVCAALWELGKDDEKKDGFRFEHPIGVLEQLCGFQENKPLEFCERVFDFAMKLSTDPAQWKFKRKPLEIMLPVLSTEGMSTTANSRSVTFKPFLISYDTVKPLRERLIAHLLDLLENIDPAIARVAADAMDAALRGPFGIMQQDVPKAIRDKYDAEFEQTIQAIMDRVRDGKLAATTMIAIAGRIVWLAEHGPSRVKKSAKAYLALVPRTLDLRLTATLIKGNGSDLTGEEWEDGYEERDAEWLKGLSTELKAHYAMDALLDALDDNLRMIEAAGFAQVQPGYLIYELIRDDLELARLFIEAAAGDAESRLRPYLHSALGIVLNEAPQDGQAIVERFLDSADEVLARAGATAFGGLRRPPDQRDQALLKRALASPKPSIVQGGMRSIFLVRLEVSPRVIIDLAKAVHFDIAPRLADDMFMMFRGKSGIMAALTREDVQHFLSRLRTVEKIDGYNTQDFLAHISERFPFDLIDFFLWRVEYAVERKDYNFRPANYGPYAQKPLRLSASAEAPAVLAHVWAWLYKNRDREGWVFYEQTGNLFEAIFPGEAGADLAKFFDAKLDTANKFELELMARLLRKAGPDFVFAQRAFVVRFLDRCKATDAKLKKDAIESLYVAARSGAWGGTVGEPFPRDIRHRDESAKIIATLPRFSAAYELYEMIKKAAEHAIAQTEPAIDDE